VALGVEVFVERVFAGAGRVIEDDGDGALLGDRLTQPSCG